MKSLLIIGAGGHGKVVKEIAEDLGYEKIDFLDDSSQDASGRIDELERFLDYREAFIGIGNNRLREKLLEKAEQLGYEIPILIHPAAYVSKTAALEKGTIIEPKAVVNAGAKIAEGTIVSVGSIIDHDAVIGRYAHINAGAILKAGGKVSDYEKLEAGEIRLGYPAAVNTANSNDEFAREEKERTGKDVSFF